MSKWAEVLPTPKAQQVAPLMTVVNMDVGEIAYFRHRYDEAIELYN